jgi:hypothetical protein
MALPRLDARARRERLQPSLDPLTTVDPSAVADKVVKDPAFEKADEGNCMLARGDYGR